MKKVYLATVYNLKNSKSKGFFALVDDEDFEAVSKHKWYLTHGYAHTKIKDSNGVKRTIKMHRFIMNPPKDKIIDHKDHNKLNNQKSNLRICTNSDNRRNIQPTGTSKYLGVHIANQGKSYAKFTATIYNQHVKKYENLGRFPLSHEGEITAALMYNKRAAELAGEFANLNVIEDKYVLEELLQKFAKPKKEPKPIKKQKQKFQQKKIIIKNKKAKPEIKISTPLLITEGFIHKNFTFGWKNKILYRLPITTKDGRHYGLRIIPQITLYTTRKGPVKGYHIIRDKKSLPQVRRMTGPINVEVLQNKCRECA